MPNQKKIKENPFNPSAQEAGAKAQARRSLRVGCQPNLPNEFQANQDYNMRPCLRKQIKKKIQRSFLLACWLVETLTSHCSGAWGCSAVGRVFAQGLGFDIQHHIN